MRSVLHAHRRAVLVLVGMLAIGLVGAWLIALSRATVPGREGQAAGPDGSVGEEVRAGLTLYPVGRRPSVPNLHGQTLDGGQLALADLRGHVVVLNVWGSWCNPCRAETPELVRLAGETRAEGVRFVGVDTRDNPAAEQAFVRTFKVPYPSLVDRDGQVLLAFNGVIPVSAVPSTVVITPSGEIAARVIGRVRYATLRGVPNDVRSEAGATTPAGRSGAPR